MAYIKKIENYFVEAKNKNDDYRNTVSLEIKTFLEKEFKILVTDSQVKVINLISELLSKSIRSSDLNDRKTGLYFLFHFIDLEINDYGLKLQLLKDITGFVPTSDVVLMTLNASIFMKYLQIGYITSDLLDYEIKKAKKYLIEEQIERKAYTLILYNECLKSTSALFFPYILEGFHSICACISDPKSVIRDTSLSLIKNCFKIFISRENKEVFIRRCYEALFKTVSLYILTDSSNIVTDDMLYGSMMALYELILACSGKTQLVISDINESFNGVLKTPSLNITSIKSLKIEPKLTSINILQKGRAKNISPSDEDLPLQSTFCHNLIEKNYSIIIDFLLKSCSNKNTMILQIVLPMIAMLCGHSPVTFSKDYLTPFMTTAFTMLANNKERNHVFMTIAVIYHQLKDKMSPYTNRILKTISSSLSPKESSLKRKRVVVDSMVLACMSFMAEYCNESDSRLLYELFNSILDSTLLTSAVVTALCRFSNKNVDRKSLVKNLIHIVLFKILKVNMLQLQVETRTESDISEEDEVNLKILGLKTLRIVELTHEELVDNLYDAVQFYLSCAVIPIRIESVKTCCHLMSIKLDLFRINNMSQEGELSSQLFLALRDLCVIGISDPEDDIRIYILNFLLSLYMEDFSHPDFLKVLCLGVRDKSFEVQQTLIEFFGLLSHRNPLSVSSFVEKCLSECFVGLTYNYDKKGNDALYTLWRIVFTNPRISLSCLTPILDFLVPKISLHVLTDEFFSLILVILSDLSFYAGETMLPRTPKILHHIRQILINDGSAYRKECAVKCLVSIIQHTGYFIEGVEEYLEMFDCLLHLILSEQTKSLRKSIIQAFGCIGARDIYQLKQKLDVSIEKADVIVSIMDISFKFWDETYGSKNIYELIQLFSSKDCLDEFYSGVCISILVKVLNDSALSAHHSLALQVIQNICGFVGNKCHQFLCLIIPTYIKIFRICDANMKKIILEHIAKIVSLVKDKIHPYFEEIFSLIDDFWDDTSSSVPKTTIIKVVEYLVLFIPQEINRYLPRIIPKLMNVLTHDGKGLEIEDNQLTTLLLSSIQRMAPFIKDHLFLFVPGLIKTFDDSFKPIPLQILSLTTLQTLFLSSDLEDFLSPTLQSVIRVLNNKPELQQQSLTLLVKLCENFPTSIKMFVPLIDRALKVNKLNNPELDGLLKSIENSNDSHLEAEMNHRRNQVTFSPFHSKKDDWIDQLSISSSKSTTNYMRLWQTTQRISKSDWFEWFNHLTLEMIKDSPSPIIRFCSIVAQSYGALGPMLFNFSFYSCWRELKYTNREDLIKYIINALEMDDINELVVNMLNLLEFMEKAQSERIPIELDFLANRTLKSSSFVKSLRYQEEILLNNENVDTLHSLISLNMLLNNHDAAQGVLDYSIKRNFVGLMFQQRWLEKLQDWDGALLAYEKKLEQDPKNSDFLLGKMRCLEALCEWDKLDKLVTDHWSYSVGENKVQLSRMGSYCSIGLGNWSSLKSYIPWVSKHTFEGSFLRSIYYVHSNACEKALNYLDRARNYLDDDISAVFSESYERGYDKFVICQLLTELDEIINFKLFANQRESLKKVWHKRLICCRRIVGDWQRLLDLRTLVLSPDENLESWLKFSNVCRKAGRYSLCERAFEKLIPVDKIAGFNNCKIPDNVHPSLILSYIKYMWESTKNVKAYDILHQFVQHSTSQFDKVKQSCLENYKVDISKIVAKSYLQLGYWNMSGLFEEDIPQAREHFIKATEYGNKWGKAWQSWAKINYEISMNYKQNNKLLPTLQHPDLHRKPQKDIDEHVALTFVLPAIQAFFRSIHISNINSFQDTLRLLTLWFEFGEYSCIYPVLEQGIKDIKIDNWLQVIPQLIARIETPKQAVRNLIQQLLIQVGCQHPQAFIYPLMVSSNTLNDARTVLVREVLKSVSENFPGLVEQAGMVSKELIRVSVLWNEEWCSGIEEASKLFFNEKNIPACLSILDAMHKKISNEPETPTELSFIQNNGKELKEAYEYRMLYSLNNNITSLIEAWSIYYQIFKRLSKQVSQVKVIDLERASPKLLECRHLILAIPGTYQPHTEIKCIQSIHPVLQVIGSKQKPRKLVMKGNDGLDYEFLLKGNEDLRQDERVMQLLGLLNNILLNNPETFSRKLEIKRYSVIPLSTNSGLIGWVPDTDTLNNIIKEYRKSKNIPINTENMIIAKYCPNYEVLDILHKVDMFEMVIESTDDCDLAVPLWQKSASSEIWFNKRTNFTRSLAVMSIVGYILGLGDRHPSNIMQERTTGKIIHIDFGDCFEVAMKREKFPEKVPFRLTRMLRKCMEVTGIEGTFKVTSIRVMEVLRENMDSLSAVLEAFIYDPLLSWRLIENKSISIGSPPTGRHFMMLEPLTELGTSSVLRQYSHVSDSRSSQQQIKPEILNQEAITVINRVKDKLRGRDFTKNTIVDVETQVEMLVEQATSIENLAQSYMGWCPFW